MKIQAIKTRKVIPPKDDIRDILDEVAEKIGEREIVVVASKIVSIHEGRCVSREDYSNKLELIEEEADYLLPRSEVPGEHVTHTVNANSWVSSAGIDGSNADGYWIVYPKDPFKSAENIWKHISEKSGIEDFGVLVTDSHSIPLRRGASGFALAYWGFNPLRDYVGKPDIFGNKLKVSKMDVATNLAASAVFVMGEGKEQTPIALIQDVGNKIVFGKGAPLKDEYMVNPEEDLFKPFFDIFKKRP